jgi:hypothetical protein
MAKKLIMFALKVGDAFQSTISALQRSDGISSLYGDTHSKQKSHKASRSLSNKKSCLQLDEDRTVCFDSETLYAVPLGSWTSAIKELPFFVWTVGLFPTTAWFLDKPTELPTENGAQSADSYPQSAPMVTAQLQSRFQETK